MNSSLSPKKDALEKFIPWIASIILFPVLLFYLLNRGDFTFLDYLNLLIHEGGHGIFRVFGDFIYTAGGTIMQMLLPAMYVGFYIFKRNKLGFQLSLFWLGENMMNISVYAADARAHVLPLLGGKNVYHDWTWMLSRLDLMAYDTLIGDLFYYSGALCFVIVLIAPLIIRKKEKEAEPVNLDLNL
jgi:hypothetical protein